ncbi:MAG: glycerophosphodiester phosphodiesterase [Acidimicrobiia bacterium]
MQPLVLGHRGASAHAADNTIEAFELAVAQGADGVELDVRFTSDGVIVLNHDPDIGEMGPLIHHDFAAIRHSHPEVPTLDEALAVLADLIINVEIKNSPGEPDFDPGDEMADAIARWINTHDLHERVVVTSFHPETAAAVRRADPTVTTGQLVAAGFRPARDLDSIVAAGHQWVAPNIADVLADPVGIVTAVHNHGLRLAVWTVDDPVSIRTVAEAGVDAIISNDPQTTLRVVSAV